MISVWIIAPVVLILYILASIKILREYERGVVFRLGRVLPEAKGPGMALVFAPIATRRTRGAPKGRIPGGK